jgi:hypothetical protein
MRFALLGFMMAFAAIFQGSAMAQTRISEGQVWTFKDAPATTARVVIQKIEPWAEGREAVHISIYGLPKFAEFTGEISHMPFDRKALEASLDRLISETPRPGLDFSGGYQEWNSASGGIFTLSISDAVKTVIVTMFGAHPPPNRT